MDWKHVGAVSLKLLKQSGVPLVVSAIYATWSYTEKQPNASPTDWITPFAASFFFCMWLIGQVLRASKQLKDSDAFKDLATGQAEIRDLLEDVKRGTITAAAGEAESSSELLQQSSLLVEQGNVLAGLLQAGVALEHAIRDKARRTGIELRGSNAIRKAIDRIGIEMGESVKVQLHTIWSLRNRLAHADLDAISELRDNPEVIRNYEEVIGLLASEHDAF